MSKESDALEKLNILVESSCFHFADELAKPIEIELKAFEIIKEKRVDITTLFDCRNAKEYNRWVDVRSHYTYRPFEITQEEYDLLKEVLL